MRVSFHCLFLLFSIQVSVAIAQEPAAADWVLESTAPWQARDSQVEAVFKDQMWIMGGWFQSFEAPPRDVWATSTGKDWRKVLPDAPWLHSDLAMCTAFKDRLWVMGGWHNGRLPGHSASHQVWSSADGKHWDQEAKEAEWSARLAAGLVVFNGRLWLLGGTEDYYFGDDNSLKNDVWSTADGKAWKLETAHAEWSPRAYHQTLVLNGRIYVMGGGNYTPSYHAKNDVWSSGDGIHWVCETKGAAWTPRLWFGSAVYRDELWVLGGWSKEHDNAGDVWHSTDGKAWQQLTTKTCWKARHEHSVLVFNDKLWVAGGHARPLSNEVWSLTLPKKTLPLITLPVRVHLVHSDTMPAMNTTLVETDVRRVFDKVNKVWSQAGIAFEIESIASTTASSLKPELRTKSEFVRVDAMIPRERLHPTALNVCYVKSLEPNGFYNGKLIFVKDTASLREVPQGIDEPLPRVTSHEIGHALGLKHRQNMTNLLASGTTGFSLNEEEIAIAREQAKARLNPPPQ